MIGYQGNFTIMHPTRAVACCLLVIMTGQGTENTTNILSEMEITCTYQSIKEDYLICRRLKAVMWQSVQIVCIPARTVITVM